MNPHLKDEVLLHANYTFRGEYVQLTPSIVSRWYFDFPYSLFGSKKHNITHNDIDNCYIVNKYSGEIIPMYYEVPCNKCIICRDKKAREWSTRAMCEAQSSTGYPLFLTLTYNNQFVPSDGVSKTHAQNFMKRLRINLNRYLGREVNLRFFLCAEYGSKTKRPHYHALIYNFPMLDTLKRTLSIVEKSWSFVVSRKNLDTSRQGVFLDEKTNRYRQQFGFVYVQMAQGGHVKYCMKYMRKDGSVPHGSNDVFYLSSRRNGLGSQWLEEHREEYYNHPQLTDVTFTDKWSMANYTAAMPSYFKTKLYPIISKLLPKDIRDDFNKLVHFIGVRSALLDTDFVTTSEKELFEKYAALSSFRPDAVPQEYIRILRKELTENKFSFVPFKLPFSDTKTHHPQMALVSVQRVYDGRPSESDSIDEIIFDTLTEEIAILTDRLKRFSYDNRLFEDAQYRKNIRISSLRKAIESQPDVDINTLSRSIYERRQMQLQNETF